MDIFNLDLNNYLIKNGFYNFEGNCSQVEDQMIDLIDLIKTENIINVMEIGFNAGHSSNLFLKHNNLINITSFDINMHEYTQYGANWINKNYPNRFNIIYGDSSKTVPNFMKNNINIKFDLIFIDGGHYIEQCTEDMKNCYKMCHKDTIIILDDVIFTKNLEKEWTIGPTLIWKSYIANGLISELGRKEYGPGRGMAWGKCNYY